MLEDLLEAIRPREERVKLGGRVLVVKELATAADVASMRDNKDLDYKLVVRCVFLGEPGAEPDSWVAGPPAFAEDDIPALKAGAKTKLVPLLEAVNRVNGFDIEAEEKNSAAVPG